MTKGANRKKAQMCVCVHTHVQSKTNKYKHKQQLYGQRNCISLQLSEIPIV